MSAFEIRYEIRHAYCIRQCREGEWWYYTGEIRNGATHFSPAKDDALEMSLEEAHDELKQTEAPGGFDSPEVFILHSYRVIKRENV